MFANLIHICTKDNNTVIFMGSQRWLSFIFHLIMQNNPGQLNIKHNSHMTKEWTQTCGMQNGRNQTCEESRHRGSGSLTCENTHPRAVFFVPLKVQRVRSERQQPRTGWNLYSACNCEKTPLPQRDAPSANHDGGTQTRIDRLPVSLVNHFVFSGKKGKLVLRLLTISV